MHEKIYKIYSERVEFFIKREKDDLYGASVPLKAEVAVTKSPVAFADRQKLEYRPVQVGEVWGHEWESAWFHVSATIPKEFAGKELCLRIHTGGEACVFDKSGCPIYGLTGVSIFDSYYYKDRFVLGNLKAGTKIDYWIEAAANGLFGIERPAASERNPERPNGSFNAVIKRLELCVFNRDAYNFFIDMDVLHSMLKALPMEDYRARVLLRQLNKALDIYNYDPANAADACAFLKEAVYSNHAEGTALTACAIGHAHIDVGWMWPVRESIRKVARTYSSQLALMDKYPAYKFGGSQAQLYQMCKEHYPKLYEKVKARVAEGRWELQGGWWVEADCNLISGESMVRQFLHGKNFFMDEFGIDVRNLWIPDVFGYSAAMPQIMKKSGCDYFLTQKISWSQVNTFPYHTFRWVGVDGSEVITHFPPENSYNCGALPEARIKGQNRYNEADICPKFMSLFGIGDGGGGPSEDFVERNSRMADLEGCPKAVNMACCDFFESIKDAHDDLPVWNGELYLEFHRGTLTTQAHTKRNNRKCEQALTQLEFLAACLPPSKYPRQKLDWAWKKVLLNQFHDIIPGSSIRDVYEVTEAEHAEVLAMCAEETRKAATALCKADGDCVTLFNTLPVQWEGCVTLPDDWKGCDVASDDGDVVMPQVEDGKLVAFVYVPASGTVTLRKGKGRVKGVTATKEYVLENRLVRYTFNDEGQLVSAVDLEEGREIMSAPGNVLSLYNDHPIRFDAWDVDMFYPKDFKDIMPCVEATPAVVGPSRSFLKFTFKTATSTMTQTVILTPDSTRLDFVTHVDWHEERTMLRTSFPVAIASDNATYDIQYAFIKRPTHNNTSWEQAKFEMTGQRYADLSQDDYGVALLNDCKYGYKIKGSVIDMNLLRSPKYPDYNADQGEHDFTYSFYPHGGNHVEGGVPEMAAVLNREPVMVQGVLSEKAKVPCTVESDSVTMEVLKRAEKDNSLIVRLVETAGKHAEAQLHLAAKGAKVSETNLIEWEQGEELPQKDGAVELSFKPFEIRTFRIK